jgi:hypothetical protein
MEIKKEESNTYKSKRDALFFAERKVKGWGSE